MQLFGFNIQWQGFNGNGKYVKKETCQIIHKKLEDLLNSRFNDLQLHVDKRVDDFINSVNNYIKLLKK